MRDDQPMCWGDLVEVCGEGKAMGILMSMETVAGGIASWAHTIEARFDAAFMILSEEGASFGLPYVLAQLAQDASCQHHPALAGA